MIQDWLNRLLSSQGSRVALAVGLSLGVGIVLLLRAGQAWRYRQALGYTTYAADRLRRRLARWAGLAVALAALVGGLFLWRGLQPPADVALVSEQPALAEKRDDLLAGVELIIPRLGVQAPVIEASFVAREWDISLLTNEVAHLAGTAYPGEEGNMVIAGHITIPGGGWGRSGSWRRSSQATASSSGRTAGPGPTRWSRYRLLCPPTCGSPSPPATGG